MHAGTLHSARPHLFVHAGIVLTFFLPSIADAWNNLGHKVVAEIAWRQLDPETRQEIVETLRRHPRFDTDFIGRMEDEAAKADKATQDHWIFQHAATWPDLIRKNKEYDHPTWHYIDFPFYLDSKDEAALARKLPVNLSTDYPSRTPKEKYNVLQAIAYNLDLLRSNAGPDIKAIAYCWVFHLVGDIHQPLHSTALFSESVFPKGDEGGNKIKVGQRTKIHSVWDGLLGSRYHMRDVMKAADELSDQKRFSDIRQLAENDSDPRKWAEESHTLCISPVVYSPQILDAVRSAQTGDALQPLQLPKEYYKKAGEVARRRVLTAGLRLGALLKSVSAN